MTTGQQILATLAFSGVLAVAAGADGTPRDATGSTAPEAMSWRICDTRVLKSGKLCTNQAGISLEGYTVEGKAMALGGDSSQVPQGKFYLVLNAFCPTPTEVTSGGFAWYGRGTWTLVGTQQVGKATGPARAGPHPGVLQGHLLAELDASPAANPTKVSATVWAPAQPIQDDRVKYRGAFSGNGQFEGRLSLETKRPAATGPPAAATPAATEPCCPAPLQEPTNKTDKETVFNPAKTKE